jgi:hypothetical protein
MKELFCWDLRVPPAAIVAPDPLIKAIVEIIAFEMFEL